MNVLELIKQGSKKLASKNILSHKLDSEILLSKILEKNREQIILNQNTKLYQIIKILIFFLVPLFF